MDTNHYRNLEIIEVSHDANEWHRRRFSHASIGRSNHASCYLGDLDSDVLHESIARGITISWPFHRPLSVVPEDYASRGCIFVAIDQEGVILSTLRTQEGVELFAQMNAEKVCDVVCWDLFLNQAVAHGIPKESGLAWEVIDINTWEKEQLGQ